MPRPVVVRGMVRHHLAISSTVYCCMKKAESVRQGSARSPSRRLNVTPQKILGASGLRNWWDPTGDFHEHRSMSGAAHQEQSEGREESREHKRQEQAKLPTMEAHLRKLYMRVHPDLFSSHPEARDANEKSFQLLSEFLNVIKNQDGRGGIGKVFKLEFYMRPAAEPGEGDAAVSADLEQVTVSLRADGSPRDKKKQLSKLFEACGIFGEFAFNAAGGGAGTRGGGFSGPASDLEVWIREHSHAAAVARQDHDRAWRAVYAQQHALQLWHKVRVSFADDCATWSPDARAELLKQLLSDEVLATLQMQGVDQDHELDLHASRHVVLADSNSIHADGRVTLASDAPESWARYLSTMDWSRVAAVETNVKELRDSERTTAQWLGLAYVHGATSALEQSNAYSSLLQGIRRKCEDTSFAAHVQRRTIGADGEEGALMQRPVMLVQQHLDTSVPQLIKHFDGCAMDPTRGLLLIAVNAPLENVLSLVQTYAQEAAECRARFEQQRKALSMLLAEAKTSLGLATLEVDWQSGVVEEQALACCANLIAASGSLLPPRGLAPLTQGLNVCIGVEYCVRQDGAMVLPYNIDVTAT